MEVQEHKDDDFANYTVQIKEPLITAQIPEGLSDISALVQPGYFRRRCKLYSVLKHTGSR